jgi:Chitobiase/beta-hexosaminidase C-terminal domain
VVVQRRPGGAAGEYWQRYNSPFRPTRNDDENPFGQAQLRRALLGDGHATGFGHVAPLPLESMLHDGLADTPGPALGCEGSPSAQWAVTNTTPGAVNLNNRARGLTVRGLSNAATAVTVSLTDSDPTTAPRTVTKAATLAGPAGGRQTWTASFTQAQLRGLNGRIRVGARHTTAGGQFAGTAMTVLKDLVAPNAPRASLREGTYNRTRRVSLRTGTNNQIRFTLGDGSQARPTRNRGAIYRGQRIRISSTQVLKAIAVDRAGNVSPLLRNRYRIR